MSSIDLLSSSCGDDHQDVKKVENESLETKETSIVSSSNSDCASLETSISLPSSSFSPLIIGAADPLIVLPQTILSKSSKPRITKTKRSAAAADLTSLNNNVVSKTKRARNNNNNTTCSGNGSNNNNNNNLQDKLGNLAQGIQCCSCQCPAQIVTHYPCGQHSACFTCIISHVNASCSIDQDNFHFIQEIPDDEDENGEEEEDNNEEEEEEHDNNEEGDQEDLNEETKIIYISQGQNQKQQKQQKQQNLDGPSEEINIHASKSKNTRPVKVPILQWNSTCPICRTGGVVTDQMTQVVAPNSDMRTFHYSFLSDPLKSCPFCFESIKPNDGDNHVRKCTARRHNCPITTCTVGSYKACDGFDSHYVKECTGHRCVVCGLKGLTLKQKHQHIVEHKMVQKILSNNMDKMIQLISLFKLRQTDWTVQQLNIVGSFLKCLCDTFSSDELKFIDSTINYLQTTTKDIQKSSIAFPKMHQISIMRAISQKMASLSSTSLSLSLCTDKNINNSETEYKCVRVIYDPPVLLPSDDDNNSF